MSPDTGWVSASMAHRAHACCAGREAALVLTGFPPGPPLLGWYSAAEIGPVHDNNCPMNWTGVLLLFPVGKNPHG